MQNVLNMHTLYLIFTTNKLWYVKKNYKKENVKNESFNLLKLV